LDDPSSLLVVYEAVAPVGVVPYSAVEELALESGDLFAGMRATLDQLWGIPECRGIQRTKLARRRFVSLLTDRVLFMQDLRRSMRPTSMNVGQSPHPLYRVLIGRLKEYFWERLARVLLLECINLCNENMRQDWADPKLQLIWSVRDKTGSNFALIVRQGARKCPHSGSSTSPHAVPAVPLGRAQGVAQPRAATLPPRWPSRQPHRLARRAPCRPQQRRQGDARGSPASATTAA
jgi:hypothetical protein